jgi:hypothetical protein
MGPHSNRIAHFYIEAHKINICPTNNTNSYYFIEIKAQQFGLKVRIVTRFLCAVEQSRLTQAPTMAAQQQQVAFALAPGLINHAEIIDYSTREGLKLFEMASKSLNDKIALDHRSLSGFLQQLGDRAMIMGWRDILKIPPDLNDVNQTTNLLTRYGSLFLEQVRAHATTYVNGNNRAAQEFYPTLRVHL